MEQLPMGMTLDLPEGVFPLSTDSMVLSHFCRGARGKRWLDLGSGGGTLGLLLCAEAPSRTVTGVELNAAAHEAALENIRRNALAVRMQSICADLREVPGLFPAGSFSCCIANPPYFSGGPVSTTLPAARHRETCAPEDLCRSAAWALQYGGDLFLVCPPETLAEWIAAGTARNLQTKVLRLVRHREGGPAALALLRLRKGGKPGLRLEEISLHDAAGNQTEVYKEIYHMGPEDRQDT